MVSKEIVPGHNPAPMSIVFDDPQNAKSLSLVPAQNTERGLALACVFIGLAVTVMTGQSERMGVVHADDLTHFLIAKWSWKWPSYFLNDWGRPGFTDLYAPAAFFGWRVARILSAGLTAATALLSFEIAANLRLRHSWLVVPLFYVQPLVFKLSETTLTETPLMFYLTLALFLAQRHRWIASSAILSVAFVTRDEAVLFFPIWIIVAGRNRVPLHHLLPLLWAPLTVNALAAAVGVTPMFSRLINPASTGQYGHGGWLTFFARSMEAWGPAIAILALAGFVRLVRQPGGGLIAACAAVYFGGQTALRALGLYNSGGYARFLVPISPLIAVAAVVGWNALLDPDPKNRRRATAWTVAAMILLWVSMERQLILYAHGSDEIAELPEVHHAKIAVRIATIVICLLGWWAWKSPGNVPRTLFPTAIAVLIGLAAFQFCRPLTRPAEVHLIEDAMGWLSAKGYSDRPILSANVWLDFLQRRELPPDRQSVASQLAAAPPGTLFAWEKQFAGSPDHHISLEDLAGDRAFQLLYKSRPLPYHTDPYLFVFEKIAP